MWRVIRILIVTLAALVVAGPAFAGTSRAAGAATTFGALTIHSASANPNGAPPELFVSAMTGNDRNRCLRPEDACLTIQSAFDRIPAVLENNVVVHIAAGNYGGDLYLGDRLSPKRFGISVLGEPGVVIDGVGTQATGLAIANIASVTVKNVEFRGFAVHAIQLDRVRLVQLVSIRLVDNQGEGLHAEESSAVIVETVVERNGGDGIYCTGGVFTIGDSPSAAPGVPRLPTRTVDTGGSDDGGPVPVRVSDAERPRGGVVLSSNGGVGVMASACSVQFGGWASISGNGGGLAAAHGGVIDLAGRSDIEVRDNVRFQMMSGCAGMVCRYANAPVRGDCETINYGTCSPN